jgi:hypothetical protein
MPYKVNIFIFVNIVLLYCSVNQNEGLVCEPSVKIKRLSAGKSSLMHPYCKKGTI